MWIAQTSCKSYLCYCVILHHSYYYFLMKPGCWSERSWRSLVYKKELQRAVNSLINILYIHHMDTHTHRLKTHPGLLSVLDDSIEITFLLSTHWVFVPLTTFYTLMLWKGNLVFWKSWINWCIIFIFYILNKCISLNILLCLLECFRQV